MTIEIERFPYPFNDNEDGDSGVKGWVVPVEALGRIIDTPDSQSGGVQMAIRDKTTGEYVDPERFGLFIRYKAEATEPEDSTVFIWYGGDPGAFEDDGWYNDFPPIPPGD